MSPIHFLLNQFEPIINLLQIPGFQSTCPICKSSARFEFKNREFTICKCTSCEHAFVKNKIPEKTLQKKYHGWDYWIKDKIHQGIQTVSPGDYWQGYLTPRLKIISEWFDYSLPKQSVLEIGASEGNLLFELEKKGFETHGVEFNREIVEKGRAEYNQDIAIGDFLKIDFKGQNFDLIVSFHTFEHLVDIQKVTEKCFDLLKPNGVLIIEVPFGVSEYKNLDHLHFFSEDSCQKLFGKYFHSIKIQKNQYETAENIAMGSYYVSGVK